MDNALFEVEKEKKLSNYRMSIDRILTEEVPYRKEENFEYLLKGYLIRKHSKSQKKGKFKFLYISEDLKNLCWKSLRKEEEKRIKLSEVKVLVHGESSINFMQSSTCLNFLNCIVIVGEGCQL